MGINKKTRFLPGLAVCLIMVMGLSLAIQYPANGNASTGETPAKLVKAVRVQQTSSAITRSFPGTAQANYESDLAFRVGGPLTNLDVEIGQSVAKGEIIARIDQRDFLVSIKRLEASIAQAQANLKAMRVGARAEDIVRMEASVTASEAQLEEAHSNIKRYQSLYDQKAVAKATYDTALTGYENAQAGATAAKKALEIGKSGARQEDIDAMEAQIRFLRAGLEAAENAKKDTELRAPISGFVNKKYVDNFETVNVGQPIVSLLDTSSVEVKTSVPQTLIAQYKNWNSFTCTFDAYPGESVSGKLKEIGQKTEGPGMSYPLIVSLNLPEEFVIFPGMAADVSISLASPDDDEQMMYVPVTAVFADDNGQSCVWKIENSPMTVTKIQVTIGEITKHGVIIKDGVKTGDLIVGAGARFLIESEAIRLLENGQGGSL